MIKNNIAINGKMGPGGYNMAKGENMAQPNGGGGITNITRPVNLDEIVGMEYNKKIVKYHVGGSKKLNDPLPSFIVIGPAGCGKSTLAAIIANYSKGQVHKFMGSEIKSPDDIYNIATQVKDGDIIFIEEAHTIGGGGPKSKICQSIIYEWIEDFALTGGGNFGVTIAPKVSFVLATTDPGRLTPSLRGRCQILNVSYYPIEDIKEILDRAGKKLHMELRSDDEALTLLAKSSRGTPRIAVMSRLDMVRKVMAEDNLPWGLKTVQHFMHEVGINEWGLEPNDILYCKTLRQKLMEGNDKPVAKKTMEQATGFTDNMIENVIEAYLVQIGAIQIEKGGRVLTAFGYSLIGASPSGRAGTPENILMPSSVSRIDLEALRKDLADPEMRKRGMKELMPRYGLKYLDSKARNDFKDCLLKLGYRSVQRIGIVPIDNII